MLRSVSWNLVYCSVTEQFTNIASQFISSSLLLRSLIFSSFSPLVVIFWGGLVKIVGSLIFSRHGRWSLMSFTTMLDSYSDWNVLPMIILSRSVAVFLVILVGLVMVGSNWCSRLSSMNSFVGLCLAGFIKSRLWSNPIINLACCFGVNFFRSLV